MCVTICECCSCFKKNTCTDCEHIESHKLTEYSCEYRGVRNCAHKVAFKPPKEMIEKERWRLDVVGNI